MVNVDKLPKSLRYDGKLYFLGMHVTAWNKLCLCYKIGFEKPAPANLSYYTIFSNVVEPDCNFDGHFGSPLDIVDVPSFEAAVNILSARVNSALSSGMVQDPDDDPDETD